MVTDGDMFHALKKDADGDSKASVITDKIVKFVGDGIVLQGRGITSKPTNTTNSTGKEEEEEEMVLECDIIITATGLQLKLCGGVQVSIDDIAVDFAKEVMYKGVLISVSV